MKLTKQYLIQLIQEMIREQEEKNGKKILLDLDDEVDKDEDNDNVKEQNTTAAIAGYNMPLGAKRPSVTDYKEPYDLLDEPKEKTKIKSLDVGPNPDRTYKKLDWDKLGKNEKSDIANVAETSEVLTLKNMFEYKPLSSTAKAQQKKSKEANKNKTDTPAKKYYKQHKEEQKKKNKEYYKKNKSNLKESFDYDFLNKKLHKAFDLFPGESPIEWKFERGYIKCKNKIDSKIIADFINHKLKDKYKAIIDTTGFKVSLYSK